MTLRSLVASFALLLLAAAPLRAEGACHLPEAGHEGKVDIITQIGRAHV